MTDEKRRFGHRWPEQSNKALVCYTTLDFDLVDGRMEVKTLTIRMASHKPLTTSVIRDLPLGTWMAEDRRTLGRGSSREWVLPERERRALRLKRIAEQRSSAGRPKVSAELLAEVAGVYRQAHASGAAPTQAVADHFKRPRSTAAKWVQRAREEGLLGPTEERRPGETRRAARKPKR